jgi:hypothetical protein
MQNGTPYSNFVGSFMAQSAINWPLTVEVRNQCQFPPREEFSWMKNLWTVFPSVFLCQHHYTNAQIYSSIIDAT